MFSLPCKVYYVWITGINLGDVLREDERRGRGWLDYPVTRTLRKSLRIVQFTCATRSNPAAPGFTLDWIITSQVVYTRLGCILPWVQQISLPPLELRHRWGDNISSGCRGWRISRLIVVRIPRWKNNYSWTVGIYAFTWNFKATEIDMYLLLLLLFFNVASTASISDDGAIKYVCSSLCFCDILLLFVCHFEQSGLCLRWFRISVFEFLWCGIRAVC